MKISFKHQAVERKNSDVCVVTEHSIDDEMIDFVIVKVTGRYPEHGYAINQKCKEIVYLHEGNGIVVVNEKEYLINSGDLILIEAGEKFFWEGNMNLFISCTPAFTIEQHKMIN